MKNLLQPQHIPFKEEDKKENQIKKKSKFNTSEKDFVNDIAERNENKDINTERIQIDKKDDKVEDSIIIKKVPIEEEKKEDDKIEDDKKEKEPKKKTICQYIKEKLMKYS